MEATIVVAMTPDGGVGHQGTLPWHVPAEMRHFHRLTTATKDPQKVNAVVMGRKTWDSLPIRPLPKRVNIILSTSVDTSHQHLSGNVIFSDGMSTALMIASKRIDIENVYIIGGAKVYESALDHPLVAKACVSIVHTKVPCDVFFPLAKASRCGWGNLLDTADAHDQTTDSITGIRFTTFERTKSRLK